MKVNSCWILTINEYIATSLNIQISDSVFTGSWLPWSQIAQLLVRREWSVHHRVTQLVVTILCQAAVY